MSSFSSSPGSPPGVFGSPREEQRRDSKSGELPGAMGTR